MLEPGCLSGRGTESKSLFGSFSSEKEPLPFA